MKRKLYFYLSLCIALIAFPFEILAQDELRPGNDATIQITSQDRYTGGTFNGTVNGTNVTIASITFAGSAEGSFTFKNINVTELIVAEGADVIIEIANGDRKNTISKITNNGKLFLKGETFLPEADGQDITNNAFLTDSTASIRVVDGAAHLIIGVTEGSEVHNEPVAPLKTIVVTETPTESVTLICQRKNMLWWNDLDTLYVPTYGGRIIECDHEVERAGQYRFRVIHENNGVITSLISRTAEVKMTYDVTLPEVDGATTDPAAGIYPVADEGKFDFFLSLEPGYSHSEPLVTTSKNDTLAANIDGIYSIKNITDSLTIFIDNVKEDIPSSNEEIAMNRVVVKSGQGQIEIYTPEATPLQIFSFDGIVRYNRRLPAGNHLISMPPGVYLLKTDKQTFKAMV